MIAPKRVIEYSKLIPEAPLESSPGILLLLIEIFKIYVSCVDFSLDKKPHVAWPAKGAIKFDEMSFRYSKDEAPILNKISFQIREYEKVSSYFY